MTFIAGLRRSGLVAPWVLEGAMDGDAFKTYTAEILAPTLAPGDIVVMDNLPAHKVAGIAETFAKKKAQLFYLPPYSLYWIPVMRQAAAMLFLRPDGVVSSDFP